MMAAFLLPDLKISEETQDSDIEKLINIIKPSWNTKQLQTKLLSGGYWNRMFRCYDENSPEDSVTIRVRHLIEKISKEKLENPLEVKIVQYLSSIGHFPKVHAIFGNGYCYQYIKGQSMVNLKERTGYVDDYMLRSIANEMAFIHSIKFDDIEYTEKATFSFLDILLKSLDPEKPLNNGLNLRVLLKELDLITNFLRNKNCEPVTCHGDPHPGNYVWNKEQKKLTFVDWEGVNIGYQYSEIAQLFLCIKTMNNIFSMHKVNQVIEEGFEERFVKYYIEAWKKIKNDNTKIIEEDITQWMTDIETFKLAPQFLFICFAVNIPDVFVELSGDINMVDEVVIKDYLKLKEKILGKGSFESE